MVPIAGVVSIAGAAPPVGGPVDSRVAACGVVDSEPAARRSLTILSTSARSHGSGARFPARAQTTRSTSSKVRVWKFATLSRYSARCFEKLARNATDPYQVHGK